MIDSSFIDKIESMALPVKVSSLNGEHIRRGQYNYELVRPEPFPAVSVRTLTGLLDYIGEKIDGGCDGNFIHVSNPSRVSLCGFSDEDKHRDVYAEAGAMPCEFPFNTYHAHEEFIVRAMAAFVRNDKLVEVLQAVSTMRHEKIQTSRDDNMSQEISVREGISRSLSVKIENPVTLQPYSTFAEIDQPERDFVLRFRGGGDRGDISLALFEVDGRSWEGATVLQIKAYLVQRIQELVDAGVISRAIPVIA